MIKILVIGSGGREHALCRKFLENPAVEKIYVAPGNGGTKLTPRCENVSVSGIDALAEFAKAEAVDLTMVGSEELLVAGIVDKFREKGLAIFGPDRKAALLEGSKAWAKTFMEKYGVKTAKYRVFTDPAEAKAWAGTCAHPLVVKASGLAAGKGVLICPSLADSIAAIDEIMVNRAFQEAGDEVVIEEYLEGVEASILSLTDSRVILPFVSAKDHKKVGEGDTGLNTGGMGTIAPNPYVTEEVFAQFERDILEPTLRGIKAEGMRFAGVIFFGLMINARGVWLLEYNMRMGDPETQVVLPLLENDLTELLQEALAGDLDKTELRWKPEHACCVVLASRGYPGSYGKGYEISGLDAVQNDWLAAGVAEKDRKLLTSGGRVLNLVATGKTLEEARQKAYADVERVDFQGKYYRRDIGIVKK